MISCGLTAKLLAEVLPTAGDINVAGVYLNLQRAAERMEAELGEEKWQLIDGCQRDWDALPPPGPPPRPRSPVARAGSKSSRSRACQRKAPRSAEPTPAPIKHPSAFHVGDRWGLATTPRATWRSVRHRIEDALRIALELAFGSRTVGCPHLPCRRSAHRSAGNSLSRQGRLRGGD